MQQLHDDHSFSLDPFRALAEFKVLLHEAKEITKRELSKHPLLCVLIEIGILGHSCDVVKLGSLLKTASIHFPLSVSISTDLARFFLASLVKILKHVKLKSPPLLGRKHKKTLLWLDVGMANVPGATRNLCYLSVLLLMKSATFGE